jgi:hypothetical protein
MVNSMLSTVKFLLNLGGDCFSSLDVFVEPVDDDCPRCCFGVADSGERAGLPKDKRHFHCLKHSLGVSLVEANVNLAVIKQALGHKSIASTAIYTVPTDESAGKAVTAALASMF